jgi:hypothetical protein
VSSDEKAGVPAVSSPGNYDISRLNAVRHAILSKYTVLPWENEEAYYQLLHGLCEEHHPKGETEHYLVEQLANIIWRKRRLRLAEMALNHEMQKRVTDAGAQDRLSDVVQGRPGSFKMLSVSNDHDKLKNRADVAAYRDQVLQAVKLLKSSSRKAFDQGFAALPAHGQEWWQKRYPGVLPPLEDPFPAAAHGLLTFINEKVLPWCERCHQAIDEESMVNAKAFAAAVDFGGLEKLDRYEVALDRKFERTLAMLMKFPALRPAKDGR